MLLLLACSEPPPPPAALKDFFRPILVVNIGTTPSKGDVVQVLYHQEQEGQCHPVEKVTASIDGIPLTRLHGKVKDGRFEYDRDCDTIEFSGSLQQLLAAAPEVSEVVLTDGETTAKATVPGLFRPMKLTAGGPYTAGEAVELRWSNPTYTVLDQVGWGITLGDKVLNKKDVTLTPEAVTFTLPADVVGTVAVTFGGTLGLQPKVTSCVWAVECSASRVYVVEPVTIEVRPAD